MSVRKTALSAALLGLAMASPAHASAEFDAFIETHGDGRTALALERSFADAIARGDRGWLRETARRNALAVRRILDETDKAAAERRVGPCHLAWLSLQTLVFRTASASGPALKGAVPADIADLAAEHLSSCERVKRLPRSPRLVGTPGSPGHL